MAAGAGRMGEPAEGAAFQNPERRVGCARMKFITTLDRDEDGVWIAECPSIPGCVSQGDSRDEAFANIREAIAACLEVRAERGLPLTVEMQQVEVVV
jgi:predicted RNase H-like HicB family nuclease